MTDGTSPWTDTVTGFRNQDTDLRAITPVIGEQLCVRAQYERFGLKCADFCYLDIKLTTQFPV